MNGCHHRPGNGYARAGLAAGAGGPAEAWDFHPGIKSAAPRGRGSRPLADAWQFSRGFVGRVVVDTSVFLEHASALFRAAPT